MRTAALPVRPQALCAPFFRGCVHWWRFRGPFFFFFFLQFSRLSELRGCHCKVRAQVWISCVWKRYIWYSVMLASYSNSFACNVPSILWNKSDRCCLESSVRWLRIQSSQPSTQRIVQEGINLLQAQFWYRVCVPLVLWWRSESFVWGLLMRNFSGTLVLVSLAAKSCLSVQTTAIQQHVSKEQCHISASSLAGHDHRFGTVMWLQCC